MQTSAIPDLDVLWHGPVANDHLQGIGHGSGDAESQSLGPPLWRAGGGTLELTALLSMLEQFDIHS